MGVLMNLEEENQVLDYERINENFEYMFDIYSEMSEKFLSEYPGMLEIISSDIKHKNFRAFGDNAHSLKGALQAMYATEAAKCAYIIEQMGDSGETTGVNEAYTELVTKIDKMILVLADFLAEKAAL
jgi:HPt (histidine-containing phosphotransfer) domain-containing protein